MSLVERAKNVLINRTGMIRLAVNEVLGEVKDEPFPARKVLQSANEWHAILAARKLADITLTETRFELWRQEKKGVLTHVTEPGTSTTLYLRKTGEISNKKAKSKSKPR